MLCDTPGELLVSVVRQLLRNTMPKSFLIKKLIGLKQESSQCVTGEQQASFGHKGMFFSSFSCHFSVNLQVHCHEVTRAVLLFSSPFVKL